MKYLVLFLVFVALAAASKPKPVPTPKPTPSPKPKVCLEHWKTTEFRQDFGPSKFPGENITIGAEGMAWCNYRNDDGDMVPGLFILTHSQTKQRGYIKRVDPYDTSITLEEFPLVYDDSSADDSSLGYRAKDFAGLTCDYNGNFAIGGRAYLRNFVDGAPVMRAEAVLFLLDHYTNEEFEGKMVSGPVPIRGPIHHPTGLTYDCDRDSYWIADRINELVCEYKITCCGDRLTDQKIMEDYRRRWVQELHPVQCWGTNYGYYGCKNVYDKRSTIHPTNPRAAKYPAPKPKPKAPAPKEPELCDLRYISTPSYSDPEGLAVDSQGNLWVLNDAPTTNTYKLTNDGGLLDTYNIEKKTHLTDANGIAVSDKHVWVGFDHWEYKVAIFNRTCDKEPSDLVSNHPGVNFLP